MISGVQQRPFIKKLKTRDSAYIYDVNSNALIRVPPIIHELADYMYELSEDELTRRFKGRFEASEIRSNYQQLLRMQKEMAIFLPHRPTINCCLPFTGEFRDFLESNLNQLVLELTEECNMRCTYCVFSGSYSLNRNHGKNMMTRETALKAVDFFLNRCKIGDDKNLPSITFYGGEPLLKSDLIKIVTEHIRNKKATGKIRCSFTTNGVLLTPETVRFLEQNNISITISIDGPKEIHNRYRRLVNQKGTFSCIMRNLNYIKNYHPNYYRRHISVAALAAPPCDFNALIRFFHHHPLLAPLKDKLAVNFINPSDTTFFSDHNLEAEQEKQKMKIKKLKNRYTRALISGRHHFLTIEKQLFFNRFYRIALRDNEKLGPLHPVLGGCIPGQRRLFVNTGGEFFMCERVGSHYSIGDIHNGFDYKAVFKFLTDYDHFFRECSGCWALRLCNKCFNDIRRGSEFDDKKKEHFCREQLQSVENDLIIFAEILEKNKNAFSIFDDVMMT